jgi:ADP-ribose pyrophosphatase
MIPKRLERTIVYESDWINLYTDKVQYDDFIIDKYHVVHSVHESIGIIIENDRDEILLIKSFRYVIGREEWEIPAGRIENGEDGVTAARREAKEETGYEIKDIEKICSFNPNNGTSDLTIHLYRAKVGSCVCDFDRNEVLETVWKPKESIMKMLRDNDIRCGVSIIALFYALMLD